MMWLVASALFSIYAANFGTFNATYGSLGAAIGFMTWLWISAIVILLGAELNAEMEHQTARDTTTGAPKPMGARGAKMADTPSARLALDGRIGRPLCPFWNQIAQAINARSFGSLHRRHSGLSYVPGPQGVASRLETIFLSSCSRR
jgi:hypothetical protein